MRRMAGAVLAAAAMLAACTSKPEPGPTPSFTPDTGTPSAPITSASSVPLQPAVSLAHGSAVVKVTGGIKTKLTLPLGPNGVFQPSPGNFSISYVGRDGNALIVSGPTPEASVQTSPDLTLSIILQGKFARAFPSSRGECTLTIRHSTSSSLDATFTCGSVTSRGKTIQATGNFEASA